MGRFLLIGLAIVLGASLAWLLLPSMQPAASPEQAVEGQHPRMAIEERLARARLLVGTELQYVPQTGVLGVDWFGKLSSEEIERAMDECMVVMEASLYREHADALRGKGIAVKQGPMHGFANPPANQVHTCDNLYIRYSKLVGAETWF